MFVLSDAFAAVEDDIAREESIAVGAEDVFFKAVHRLRREIIFEIKRERADNGIDGGAAEVRGRSEAFQDVGVVVVVEDGVQVFFAGGGSAVGFPVEGIDGERLRRRKD